MNDKPDNQFVLGEINATVKNVDANVQALRVEVGGLASRVNDVEHRLTGIEAERAKMVPDYEKFVHKVDDHIQTDVAYKATLESEKKVEAKQATRTMAWGGILVTLVSTIAAAVARYWFG